MSSLPYDVHEVLEEEYRTQYEAAPTTVSPDTFEILDEAWALCIMRDCGVNVEAASVLTVLENYVHGRFGVATLVNSPALSRGGRQFIDDYDFYSKGIDDTERKRLNRRIVDEAFRGAIKARRDLALDKLYGALHDRCEGDARTALCISGGGIRSATFALGIIQGLASAKILDKFDYLSTVSGGGYIGSWLSSWARRHPRGMTGVQDDLHFSDTAVAGTRNADGATTPKPRPDTKIDPEPPPLRHLRDYSNYLSPKLGITSADSWTLASLYVRNLLLNLLILVPILALVLAIPRFLSLLLRVTSGAQAEVLLIVTVALLFAGFAYIGAARPVAQGQKAIKVRGDRDRQYLLGAILPIAAAGVTLMIYWALTAANGGILPDDTIVKWHGFEFGVKTRLYAAGAVAAMVVWPALIYYLRYAGASVAERRSGVSRQGFTHLARKFLSEVVAAACGVVTTFVLLALVAVKVFPNPTRTVPDISALPPFIRPLFDNIPQGQLYVCFAVPIVLVIIFIRIDLRRPLESPQ